MRMDNFDLADAFSDSPIRRHIKETSRLPLHFAGSSGIPNLSGYIAPLQLTLLTYFATSQSLQQSQD